MTMRIGGLASGMDIDAMVKEMMKGHVVRRDQIYQKKVQTEWRQTEIIDLNSQLRDFRDAIFKLKLSNSTSPKSVTSGNSIAVTATATADAANTSHMVKVKSLAQGVTKGSEAAISATANANKNALKTHLGLTSTDVFTMKLNGKEISVDPNKSIYEWVNNINKAGAGVKANYDVNLDRVFLYTTEQGPTTKIDFTGTTDAQAQEMIGKLKLGASPTDNWSLDVNGDGTPDNVGYKWVGTAAEVEIDGITYSNLSKNTLTVAGVVYSFLQKTEGTAEPIVTLQVSPDLEGTVKTVKDFVDKYNEMLNKLNGELKEKTYRDFLPLTDEQKRAMKENEIKLWEEKAKSGLLRNESSLRNLVSQMRFAVSDAIGELKGKYKSLSSIGITTGLYSEGGKLYLNEDVLLKALTENPDVVSELFGTTVTKADPSNPENKINDLSRSGVAVRLYDRLKEAMDKMRVRAGTLPGADDMSDLGKQLRRYNKQLDDMEERMHRLENQYYRQFSALETALQRANAQSAWLSQQFGAKG
ncbi:flagellar hook-associated protein 2 [Heliomicrobium modesticaldum Ice1]|uniref:Flagellar hook-associated protein 2 n=1 Tax=Heliobacterium modesticaldum (strain ATCC 51547 / Ice1) TaxID=498761 RepID=B0TH38_HELMI|nr:flagellar filament capping protein FliD [Heliomicrobium modesticaldum]ABZ83363.1 flagellar hook-associated protein 2 [Heliomicrobium modesticaldum Ice1]